MDDTEVINWRDYCVTLIIFAVNTAGFVLCTQMNQTLYGGGSMNADRIIAGRQYYRLVSSMFLHADMQHFVSNMIFLVGLGKMIEHTIGHIRFAVLYLSSGVCAGLLSMGYSVMTGSIYDSAGASGAIFGLIGALFILVIVHHGNFQGVSIGRLLFAAAYMIYSGAVSARVDNAAHIGGLVSGALIMASMNVLHVFMINGK